ncbi:MAG: hypothetical protein IKV35_01055, partial [Clostridia bacterium]|nr:hypothetical protein [Clostridia bacterium]
MKKLVSVLACVLLLCGIVPMTASALDPVTFTVQTVETPADQLIKAGDEFTVTLSIGAVEELAAIECKLRYPKQLMTPVSATKEGFLAACMLADANIAPVAPNTDNPDKYGEIWVTGLAENNQAIAQPQVITTITFKAKADITGSTPIDIYMTPIAATQSVEAYECRIENGGILVEGDEMPETDPTMSQPTIPPVGSVTTTAANGGDGGDNNTVLIVILAAGVAVLGVGAL